VSEEVNPCPFCGHEDGDSESWISYYADDDGAFYFWCQECGLAGPQGRTPLEANENWNRLAVLQDGEVVVPESPSDNQIQAGFDAEDRAALKRNGDCPSVNEVYEAMIAARPKGGTE